MVLDDVEQMACCYLAEEDFVRSDSAAPAFLGVIANGWQIYSEIGEKGLQCVDQGFEDSGRGVVTREPL